MPDEQDAAGVGAAFGDNGEAARPLARRVEQPAGEVAFDKGARLRIPDPGHKRHLGYLRAGPGAVEPKGELARRAGVANRVADVPKGDFWL